MQSQRLHIWRLGLADVPEAAELMTRAFLNDPFFVTSIPDPILRREHLPPFFAACLNYGCHYGRVFGAGQELARLEGVAWWYRYPEWHYNGERTKIAGFDEVARLLGEGSDRIENISNAITDTLNPLFPVKRAVLDQLAVDPGSQRSGIGSALVQHIIDETTYDGLPIELWTASESNLTFYARHGFEVVASGRDADHGMGWWGLGRGIQVV